MHNLLFLVLAVLGIWYLGPVVLSVVVHSIVSVLVTLAVIGGIGYYLYNRFKTKLTG